MKRDRTREIHHTPEGERIEEKAVRRMQKKGLSKAIWTDHTGHTFSTRSEMASAWGIQSRTLESRLRRGMSLERALTLPVRPKGEVTDHKAVRYPDLSAMCKAYGHNISTVKSRLANGHTLQEALETPKKKRLPVADHLGNRFASKKEMAENWGIDARTYYLRRREGWTKEAALTVPKKEIPSVIDHTGHTFSTRSEMASAWGIKSGTLGGRLRRGMSLEQALTLPVDLPEDTNGLRVNETRTMKNGFEATIVRYDAANDISVRFKDGYEKRSAYWAFRKGGIGHPGLHYSRSDPDKKEAFHNIKNRFVCRYGNQVFYQCECINCGKKMILTPQQMLEHAASCSGMVFNDQCGQAGKDIIEGLSAISEENAASAQQTNASMEELNATFSVIDEAADCLQELAAELDETISFFKDGEEEKAQAEKTCRS